MKEIILSEHNTACKNPYCDRSPRHKIFYAKTNFYLITYWPCIEYGCSYDLVCDILKRSYYDLKIDGYYDIERRNDNRDFMLYRTRNIAIKKQTIEVNYIYYHHSERMLVTTNIPYLDKLANTDIVLKNYNDACDFLKQRGLYYDYIDDLQKLANLNTIYVDDMEVVRSIDNLINKINQLITKTTNGNNEKSKLEGVIEACI